MSEEEKKRLSEKEQREEDRLKRGEELLKKTNEAAERLEIANREQEKLLAQANRDKLQDQLGGESGAGEPPKKETPAEYAQRVISGEFNEEAEKDE